MEEVPFCNNHPTKPVIFWCIRCGDLVCSWCIKADHFGHKLRDLDKAANDKRRALLSKLNELQDSIRTAEGLFNEKRSFLDNFEESVKGMKQEVKIRAGEVKQWIEKHVEEMIQKIDEFAEQNGRVELRSDIMEVEERLNTLRSDEHSLKGVLKKDVKHHEVLQQWVSLSRVPTTFHEDIPLHQTFVFFPDTLAVDWQKYLARFIGVPKMAEASSQTSNMATALEMKLSSEVKALHVMSDSRLCVVFTERTAEQSANSADAGALYFGVSNHERELVLKERLGDNIKRPRLSSNSKNKVVVACTVTGAKAVFDVASWSSEVEQNIILQQHLCYLKADSGKDTLARRLSTSRPKHHKIHEVSMDSTEPLFNVQTDNPETIVADKSGEYFAVIQNCTEKVHAKVGKRSPSSSSIAPQASVAVFKRPCETNSKPQQPCTTFIPAVGKNFHPTDICFYRNVDQNVLMVAEVSGIYMVDYEHDGAWSKILSRNSPLLQTTITALTTDCDGGLWIGCENGNILNWLPKEEVSKLYYQNTTCDAEVGCDQDSIDSDCWTGFSEDDIESRILDSAASTYTQTEDMALSVINVSEPCVSEISSSSKSTPNIPFSVAKSSNASKSKHGTSAPDVGKVGKADDRCRDALRREFAERCRDIRDKGSYTTPLKDLQEEKSSSWGKTREDSTGSARVPREDKSTAWLEEASRRQTKSHDQPRCRPTKISNADTENKDDESELEKKLNKRRLRIENAESKHSAEESLLHSDTGVPMRSATADGLRKNEAEGTEGRSFKEKPTTLPKPKRAI